MRRHRRQPTALPSVGNDRGLALPSALIALSILLVLTVALAALSATEPAIAANHALGAQARSLAESGIERALWALSNPSTEHGIADPMPASPAPAPYDGAPASFRAMEAAGGEVAGGFVVAVTHAASGRANERDVTAVGYVPDPLRPRAIRKIAATAMRLPWLDPPCALCLDGERPVDATGAVELGARAIVNASSAAGTPPAAYCAGQSPLAAVMTTGGATVEGAPEVLAPPAGADILGNQPANAFEPFTLTDADLAILEELARAGGTYYRGPQQFTSPPPDGLVFVDTPSGNPLTPASPPADQFTVDVQGTWPREWRGWLIVAGDVRIAAEGGMTGLVYAQGTAHIQGRGHARLRGAVVASNRLGRSHRMDADEVGGGGLTYDCPAVRDGGGTIPATWFLKPGSYREVAGS